MTSLTPGKGDSGTASVTGDTVPNSATPVITVAAPFAAVVVGWVEAVAATTFVLQGSADGSFWVQDTAGVSVTTKTAIRFANRWAAYRIQATKDTGGTTTVNAYISVLT